jgi:hypothetical protein
MSSPVPAQLPLAWDCKALLAKTQRYVEQMLAQDRDNWCFAFWSSLALELIARAALANISPVLLADAENWNNLYYALGRTPTAPKFSPKSVAISEVLSRLQDILPEFGQELKSFCVKHTGRRNAELHSGDTPFDGLKNSEWLPLFYQSCEVLLKSMGSDLNLVFGSDEADVAAKLMKAAADKTAKEVAGQIKAHQTVWAGKDTKDRSRLAAQAELWATRQSGHVVDCPACRSKALLEGEPIGAPTKTIKDDVITETQTYLPSKFECIACSMKILGLSHLSAAGLGDAFKHTIHYGSAALYGFDAEDIDNAEHGDFEDDNNEPY